MGKIRTHSASTKQCCTSAGRRRADLGTVVTAFPKLLAGLHASTRSTATSRRRTCKGALFPSPSLTFLSEINCWPESPHVDCYVGRAWPGQFRFGPLVYFFETLTRRGESDAPRGLGARNPPAEDQPEVRAKAGIICRRDHGT